MQSLIGLTLLSCSDLGADHKLSVYSANIAVVQWGLGVRTDWQEMHAVTAAVGVIATSSSVLWTCITLMF